MMSGTKYIDGATVLITGATSGIGREMALQLASRAQHLVLVARRDNLLTELSQEIRANHPHVQVTSQMCDLANEMSVEAMLGRLSAGNVRVDALINNAGVGDVAPFASESWSVVRNMIHANVTGLVQLTHALLPPMMERRLGGVLNVSSGVGMNFMPGMAIYAATKHFVTAFTEALRLEVDGSGVVVTQVCPGPVSTDFHRVAKLPDHMAAPSIVQIEAGQCAREAIQGFDRGRAMVVPGRVMAMALWFSQQVPRGMKRLAMRPLVKKLDGGGAD